MGAVAFAEYRTTSGNMVGYFVPRKFDCVLQTYIHAACLLYKKLPGPRSAFVAGMNAADPTVIIQGIHDKRFPAGADNRIVGNTLSVHMVQGVLCPAIRL